MPTVEELEVEADYFHYGPFYYPKSAFRGTKRAGASGQLFHLRNLHPFSDRFLSRFLTVINRKNKRTQQVSRDLISRPDFDGPDDLSPDGLCNQLIECFVLKYCAIHNVRAERGRFGANIAQDYSNQLARYQTNCFALFRRGIPTYYVDGETGEVERTTVAQLIFFHWFISTGGMRCLLERWEEASEFLNQHRARSQDRKRKREDAGITKRQRVVDWDEPRCLSVAAKVDFSQPV